MRPSLEILALIVVGMCVSVLLLPYMSAGWAIYLGAMSAIGVLAILEIYL